MKKKYLIPILVLIPFILTACIKPPKKKEETITPTPANKTEESITGSLMDLLKLGKAVKCTYEVQDEDGSYTGTVYVSNKKSRSESIAKTQGQTFENYSVTDGEWLYTWSSEEPEGVKMNLSDFENEEDFDPSKDFDMDSLEGSMNIGDKFKYKCLPWVVDPSKFIPPSNIEFVDMGQMIKDMEATVEKMTQDGDQDLCAICDMSPDEASKAECKQTFGCN